MFTNALTRDAKTQALYDQIDERVKRGIKERDNLIERVATMVIRDKLVAPKVMDFTTVLSKERNKLFVAYGSGHPQEEVVTIHKHALTQLCQKVNLPLSYANMLLKDAEPWRVLLLSDNLNALFHKSEFSDRSGPPRFLHRIVGNELRGFLSRRFNRQIASLPLLVAFVDACNRVGAQPVDAIATDVKISLKCMLPFAFEPVPGEVISFGMEWTNSDFGAGKMKVSFCLWAPRSNRYTVLDTSISRVHIGSILEDSDIEMSEDTAHKEAEAQSSAVRDTVNALMQDEAVERVCGVIVRAAQESIPWQKLRSQFNRLLNKQEFVLLENVFENDIVDLPPVYTNPLDGTKTPTRWWAVQALSWLASKQEDDERRLELQQAAGSFLPVVK